MATISFIQDTLIDRESADILISQIEEEEKKETYKPTFNIEENLKEGRTLLKKLLSQRQK